MAQSSLGEAVFKLVMKDQAFQQQLRHNAQRAAQSVGLIGSKMQLAYGQQQQANIRATTAAITRQAAALNAASSAQNTYVRGQAQLAIAQQKNQQRVAHQQQMNALKGGGGGGGGGAAGLGMMGMTAATAMGGLIASGISAIISKISDAIQAAVGRLQGMVQQGISFNAQMEQTTASFEVMLGSASKAKAVLADIQKFAKDTPFEMPGLASAATSLLATRRIAQDQLLPTLKKLGDAAAGSSDGFASLPRITRAVTQMLGKGKVTGEEMMQLAEAGIPAWDALAAKMGKSTAEVMQMSQKGKLGADSVLVLVDALGERFEGMAIKQAKTFRGLMSTLTDNWNIALGAITKPIYERLKPALEFVVAAFDSAAFQSAVQGIAAGIEVVIGLVESWGMAVFEAGKFLYAAFNGQQADGFREKLTAIGGSVMEIYRNIKDALMPVLETVGAAIRGAFAADGAVTSGFLKFVNSAITGIQVIADRLVTLTSDFGLAWEYMKVKAAETALYLYEQFKYTLNERLPYSMAAFIDGSIAGVTELGKHWKTIFEAVGVFMTDIFVAVFRMQETRIKGIVAAFEAIKKGKLGDALEAIGKSEFDARMGFAGDQVKAGMDFGKAIAPAVGSSLKAAQDAMRATMASMPGFEESDALKQLSDQAFYIWEALKGKREENKARHEKEDLGESLRDWIKLGMDKAVEYGQTAFDKVRDFFNPDSTSTGAAGAAKEEKKKDRKSDFVGFAEMGKKIQGALNSGEAKARKDEVKAVKETAKSTEATVKAVEKTKDAVLGVGRTLVGAFGFGE
jgi:tape measure domain-containing protein